MPIAQTQSGLWSNSIMNTANCSCRYQRQPAEEARMNTITTKDAVEIFYKDWGKGQPIVFSHGWPLSADDWDPQMLFFLSEGYRVIATDRRGHGRSTQTGGGQVVHYLGRHGDKNVAKAAIISAVPPLMVKTPANPLGTPKSVFDDLQ